MHRRTFIKNTCLACAAGSMSALFTAGCKGIHYVTGPVAADKLTFPKSEFAFLHKKEIRYRSWVVVKNPQLPFPVGVYRLDEAHFFASYLECTHQGCELQPEGNYLQCPCHGSEFDNRGRVQHGPAEANLKTFTVETDQENLYILLK